LLYLTHKHLEVLSMMPFLEWIDDPNHGFWIRQSYDYETDEWVGMGKLVLTERQKKILGTALNLNDKGKFDYETILYSCPKKSGKALALDTPIPTPDGWTTMGEIKEGDTVFDEKGFKVNVSYVTEPMHNHSCYDVLFSDGTKITADAEHIWTLNSRNGSGIGPIVDLTTRKMFDYGVNYKEGLSRFAIKADSPLRTSEPTLPIDPYIFGLWLGDGGSKRADITCGSDDIDEILEKVKDRGFPARIKQNKNRCSSISFGSRYGKHSESFIRKLKDLKVFGDKRIPTIYLRSGISQRMDLVRGLMDSDGYISKQGRCEFTSMSHSLAIGMKELLRSLGERVNIIEGNATLCGRFVGIKYRLHFTPDFAAFKLKRKISRQTHKKPTARSRYVRVVDIISVPSVPVKCIQVDSPTHLYLAGDGMIPTHNTAINAAVMCWMAEVEQDGTEIFILANDLDSAQGRVMRDVQFHFQARVEENDKKYCKITQYRIDFPSGTFIQVVSQSFRSVAGSRHAVTGWDELWGFCLSENQLAFTKDGWKGWNELSVGDVIATLNIDTGEFEWQKSSAISPFWYDSKNSGKLTQLNHRRIVQTMTPNHKVVGKFRGSGNQKFGDIELREARDAADTYEMLQPTSEPCHGEVDEFKAAQMEVFGYYLSEGWNPSANVLRIAQEVAVKPKKGNVRQYIEDALIACGMEVEFDGRSFIIRRSAMSSWLFNLVEEYELRGSRFKFVPRHLLESDISYLSKIFNGYMMGDGWIAGKGWQTETTSKLLHENLLEMGVKLGFHVKDMGSRKRGENHNIVYRSSYSVGNLRIDKRNWKEVDYEGIVWCPTVPNGTWLTKNADTGHIAWTGNTSERSRRTWDEMTPIPTVPRSLRFISTYAGFENESDLLREMYLQGVGPDEHDDGRGSRIDEIKDLPCWENGNLFTYWDHEPSMPWQTDEYYQNQLESNRPAAYLRLHMNQWVTTHEEFIPIEWWDRSAQSYEGPVNLWSEHPMRTFPITIGIDAGIKRDSTALVGVAYDAKRGKIGVVFHKIWVPTENSPIDLERTVESELLSLYNKYNIVSIVCDPTQLHQTITKFKRKGYPIKEYPQSEARMVEASQTLYDTMRNSSFETYQDEEFRKHIQMSEAKTTTRGFRIVKPKISRKHHVDAAIALAMAVRTSVTSGGVDISIPVIIPNPYEDEKDIDEFDIPFPLRT
jgi:hypothetical protein